MRILLNFIVGRKKNFNSCLLLMCVFNMESGAADGTASVTLVSAKFQTFLCLF